MTTMADPNSLAGRYQQTLLQQQQEFLPDGASVTNYPSASASTLWGTVSPPGMSLLEYAKPAPRQSEADYYIRDGINQRNRLNPQQPQQRNLSPAEQQQALQNRQQALTAAQQPQQQTQLPPMLSGSGGLGQQGLGGGQQNLNGPQSFNQQQPPTLPPQIGQQKFGNSGIGSLGGGGQTNVSLNLQGSATMNPQGANQNRGYPGWDLGNAGASGAGASGQMSLAKGGAVPAPQGIASLKAAGAGIREIDIINSYFRQVNISPEQGVQILQAAVKAGAKFKRSGNTILVVQPLPPDAAKIYFFAIDKGEAFAQAVVELLGGLKQQGVRMVYLNKVDPAIVKTMQDIGIPTQPSDKQDYKIMAAL